MAPAPDLGRAHVGRRGRVARSTRPSGSLTIVGTGIAAGLHLTAEARTEIACADDVFYLGAEPIADATLLGLSPAARPLHGHYRPGVPRGEIYAGMAEEILRPVRTGRRVCAAFYGHPGVLVRPAHEALRRAREEGLPARMLAAVSALDCLVADLGFDPADAGLQTYDATEFLLHGRRPDPTSALVLWQLSVVGRGDWSAEPDTSRLGLLREVLERSYPAEHEVVLYEASPYPIAGPRLERLPLRDLARAAISPMVTLFVPPAVPPARDAVLGRRLGWT